LRLRNQLWRKHRKSLEFKENRQMSSETPHQSIDEIITEIGGPNAQPARPAGDPNAQPLNPLGLDRAGAEDAPQNVNAQQGAGQAGNSLTPAANQTADGTVHVGANAPDSSGGPPQVPFAPGVQSLAPGPARPDGGAAPYGEEAGAARDPRLSAGGGTGQGINPMLKPANAPKSSGLFGKKSV
jgi:hypothetical protein